MKLREHKLLSNPYIAILVITVLLFFVGQFLEEGSNYLIGLLDLPVLAEDLLSLVVIAAFTAVLLSLHRWYFQGQIPVTISTNNLGLGMFTGLSLLVVIILNFAEVTFPLAADPLHAILAAMVPGILEEIICRAFACTIAMKYIKQEKQVLTTAVFSSALFGIFHLIMIFFGADVVNTLIQVFFAFGIGLTLTAVYLRTGSILSTMIYHTIIDIPHWFIVRQTVAAFEISDEMSMLKSIGLGLGYTIAGFYLLRRAKRQESFAFWKNQLG